MLGFKSVIVFWLLYCLLLYLISLFIFTVRYGTLAYVIT